ncbi:xanthine dehydrogenase family protein molybdopterin-binding subunit [Geomobilimonas luticola]|uniref:Xanthine dehydrogenase family protein molybdopterin-binding subunit n=1 Tax=Geomobilimonas luticola TaxID=1114878 RepID=A0ABS5SDV4_9BACT|nr:xanthine dehydrogenase family protein molybdopterin-binding subunit [Geomobilimonas luticola]MBT0653533.1 xanthine dehydrogenase family protein molybdopterin-binding subunit [Geomobilimonas luticola]
MSEIIRMSRRDFLKTGAVLSGGLVLGCYLPFGNSAGAADPATTFAPNAFIRIGSDDTVTLIINKSEMGQGVYTSLPMLIAEELACDWKKIRIEAAPVDPVYNHTVFGLQVTGGSTSVRTEWERLSKAGAAAREMLIAAAARQWKVDPASCRAENGFVVHAGKKLSYGQLAAKAAKLPVPQEVRLKDPARYAIVGKPRHRLDSPAKIDGTALFGIDVQLPGLLTAVVARPPVFGGKVTSFTADKAKKVPGVVDVVQVPSGVAVIATGFWPAKKGRELLDIVWDDGPEGGLATPALRQQYVSLAQSPGLVARKEGEPAQAMQKAAKQLTAEFEAPFLAHAPMEPLNCCVDLKSDRCDIWTGTQFQTVDRNSAAEVAGLKPEQVHLHTTFLGGGFGRRANPASDFVREAVHVAKAAGKPVKVIWTRDDDMKGGFYRPFWYDRISASLDDTGNLTAWQHTIVGQSIATGTPFESAMVKNGIDDASVEGAAEIPYAIPNIQVDLHTPKLLVPVLWWRSVGHSHTAFVVESFMDEAAHAAGKDPFAFRRALLAKHPRHKGVLELAAAKAGWGKPLPAGRGRGIAVHESFGSFIAQVAEVSADRKGTVKVHRVICAIDCGRTVNPDTIRAQMESGIIFGLSAALHGAITFKNGKVEQDNFDGYPVVRMNESPAIEVHIMPSKEPPGGVGEPGVPPIAPAVANALFAATGVRLRTLPFNPKALLDGMGKG